MQAKAGQAYDSAAQGTKQARDFTQVIAGCTCVKSMSTAPR